MKRTRRILSRSNVGTLGVVEEEVPALKDGEILVEVDTSVISAGTELGSLKGEVRATGAEERWRPFGYQNAGVVVEVSPGVTRFKPGDRVACMGAGYAVHGTYANVPVNLAIHLPDSVSFEEGATIALAATAMNAVQRADLRFGEFVMVMGLGLVGQFAAQLSSIAGTHVMGVDRLDFRIQKCLASGVERAEVPGDDFEDVVNAFTRGYGLDAGYICFGGDGTSAMQQLAKLMKTSPDGHIYGRVVIPGGASVTHRFGAGLGNLDIRSAARTGPGYHDQAYEYGADYPPVFVPWTTQRNLEEIVRWLADGRLNARELVTHRYEIGQAVEACETIIQSPQKVLGVALKMR